MDSHVPSFILISWPLSILFAWKLSSLRSNLSEENRGRSSILLYGNFRHFFFFEEVALFSQHLNESEIDETIFMDGTSKVTANQNNETKREKEMKLKSATIANRNPSIFVSFSKSGNSLELVSAFE